LGNVDISIARKLGDEFSCDCLSVFPILTQLIKANELDPGLRIVGPGGARLVKITGRLGPFLVCNRDLR